jgi:hypothetical protein
MGVVLCLALLAPCAPALARPARTPRLVVALDGHAPSPAARRSLARLKLRLGAPVFRGHRDWNIWDARAAGAGSRRGVVKRLAHAPGVRWAELDSSMSYDAAAPADSLTGTPFGPLVAPDPAAPRAPPAPGASTDSTASTDAPAAPLAASTCTTPATPCAPPPTTCTPGSNAGLDSGQANDPLFCNESAGPYYA